MRGGANLDDAIPVAVEIIGDVRARGDAALLDWSEQLDRERPAAVRVSAERLAAARVDDDVLAAIRELVRVVREFHALQFPEDISAEPYPGVRTERRYLPLGSVGIYVPGGRATLPSSLIMAAVPAQVAGVKRIAVCSPRPAEVVLATARELGIDEVYAVGGAQAIGAMAYGTESIAPVDKIVGPGNAYVTSAKKQVFGTVGIDMIAGPSEVTVVSDGQSDPAWIAADLLAQAEHDASSQSVLITDDDAFADLVIAAVEKQLMALPRRETATKSWNDNGAVIVVQKLEDAATLVNQIAPEHLELAVAAPQALMKDIRHAGAIFLGRHTPEAVGDYIAGPSHELPTSGAARYASGLGVLDFLKRTSLIDCGPAGLKAIGPGALAMAEAEVLDAHALSISLRLQPGGGG